MARLRIKEIAKAQGMNQTVLQQKSQVSPQLINRYWNNHTMSASLDQLSKIAKALGVKTGDLIEDEEEDAA